MKDNLNERKAQLLEKANNLPPVPGVYIMHDKTGKVIYVGKSRKLKARVSQYFQNGEKNIKTEKMVSAVFDFEYILCETEIEALSLENTLIKQYAPIYNIRLKDAKSYPYIKVTAEEFPRIIVTRQRSDDKALYFGPYSGVSTAYSVVNTLEKALGLPNCKRSFPKDIGKERPCIYLQMGRCCGVCNGGITKEEYGKLIRTAVEVLRGNTASAKRSIETMMYAYAEEEKFEAAAKCRDTVNALNALRQKQHVVSKPGTEADIVGLFSDNAGASMAMLYVRDGAVTDKSEFTFGADEITENTDLISFICRQYAVREFIPKCVCLSFEPGEEDTSLLAEYLSEKAGHKVTVYSPKRGNMKALCDLAVGNAEECSKVFRRNAQNNDETLITLANLLQLETVPERIEAYDISNIGSEQLTAGMIVCENGKFKRSDYRVFKIKTVEGTDDYASMREALLRRTSHLSDAEGSFSITPDLILLDGGRGHVATVKALFDELNVDIPVFGMVKDDHHRTRALTTENCEISISQNKEVFVLIYKIQEEVHRFTVSRMTDAKSKTVKRSVLESIPGIGAAKAKKLLAAFGGKRGLSEADTDSLRSVKGITEKDAKNVYDYFHREGNGK